MCFVMIYDSLFAILDASCAIVGHLSAGANTGKEKGMNQKHKEMEA